MKSTTLVMNRKGAFSLVEMLVVIAVIGILAAIAVPNIGKINGAAEDSKNRRNAQQISSVCNAAQAAGLDFVAASDGSVDGVVKAVVKGDKVSDATSPFNGSYFGVPNLSGGELTDCQKYLTVTNNMLVYTFDGAAAEVPAP
jgi:prepilin-type N-terminal cleavage/methylation domain-containing protein